MADRNGVQLQQGDVVQIINMDDPAYQFLVGVRGVVEHIPEEASDTQVIIVLQDDRVSGISTQQSWIEKVV